MNIVHLTASPFFGGPERQLLGLGLALPEECRSLYLSFAERGLARPFLDQLERRGLEGRALRHNFPHLPSAIAEVAELLREFEADILFCHGYKADLIGWRAARRAGIPVVAVARGWTGATWKVHCYEWADRLCLFGVDAVVCVSEGQAAKVRRLGLCRGRIHVIRNSVDMERFATRDETARSELEALLAGMPLSARGASGLRGGGRLCIVGAAGRFSPEKGFDVLVEAAAQVCREHEDAGFVLFGEGPQRAALERRIAELGLVGRVLLPGFRGDLDRLLPALDVVALPSYTEGLPNVALEACAARVPVVATAVGGTPEVIKDGVNGFLVPPGRPEALAEKIGALLSSQLMRKQMGLRGRGKVSEEFSFAAQAQQYQELCVSLVRKPWRGRLLRRAGASAA